METPKGTGKGDQVGVRIIRLSQRERENKP